ncbi:hypothetical protein HPG69_008657, partial [Diceros bicornis minor]
MYTRAANMFKMAKNWSAAGNAFCQAAKLHMQLQSKHDSATSFVDAGNAYKKADPQGKARLRLCITRTVGPMLVTFSTGDTAGPLNPGKKKFLHFGITEI